MEKISLMNWEQIVIKILFYTLPLTFFIPLVTNSSYFFPFIVPRNLAFRALIGIAFSLFIMLLIARPKAYLPKKNYILYSIVAFLGILTISSIINGDFLYSFWSDYERMEGLLNLYFVFAFILLLVAVYRTKEDWLALLKFTVLISYPVVFIGWSQHVGADVLLSSAGGERVSSTLGNPTYLAAYALFHIFFSIYLIIQSKKDKFTYELVLLGALDIALVVAESKLGILSLIFKHATLAFFFLVPQLFILGARFLQRDSFKEYATKAYFVLIIFLNVVVLLNTQTRGAVVGLVIGLGCMFVGILFLQKEKSWIKQTASGALILMVLGGSSLFYFKDSAFIKDNKPLRRITSISLTDTTAVTRLGNWEAAWFGFKEKPILGWGEERYYVVFNKYFPEEIYKHAGSRIWFDRPHNVIIQYFVTGGALGGIAYLSIFFLAGWALFQYWKKTNDVSTFMLFSGLLIAYVIQNAFVFDSINTYILFALTIAFIISVTAEQHSDEVSQKIFVKRPPIIAGAILVVITFVLVVPMAQSNREFISAFISLNRSVESGDLDAAALENIELVIENYYVGRYEVRQHYADTAREFLGSETLTAEQKIALVQSAEKLMLKSIAEQPENVRHHAFLTSLYVESQGLIPGNATKNIDLVKRALELSPTRTHLYYALGRSLLVVGDAKRAVETFAKGVELSPKVSDAHQNYIASLITTKDYLNVDSAIEQMREGLNRELSSNEYGRIASMYQSVNELNRAIQLLDEGIERYPENTELLKQLISYNLNNGTKERAIELAQKLANFDPAFADSLNAFIKAVGNGDL